MPTASVAAANEVAAQISNQLFPSITYQVLPSAPRSLEAVRLRIHVTGAAICAYNGPRSMTGNKITVTVDCGGNFNEGVDFFVDVELGRFLSGNYTLEVDLNELPPLSLFTTEFTVTEAHAGVYFPVVDYTDHWWNAQESGWGISIMQHPSDQLFAVWFVYNQSGQPVWYTLQPGKWIAQFQFAGPIYKTTGPYFGGSFDPNQVGINQVGGGMLTFTDSNSGTFSYTVEGVTGSKTITRLPF